MTIGIVHSDEDGRCAGSIIKLAIPDVKLIETNYGRPFPFVECNGQEVIIADFSLDKEEDWKKLLDTAKKVIWIDHHKTAIDKVNKMVENIKKEKNDPNFKIDGLRSVGEPSGCQLTWQYFFKGKPEPKVVEYVGKFDTWTHNDDPEILNMMNGFNHTKQSKIAGSDFWMNLLKDDSQLKDTIQKGSIIGPALNNINEQHVKNGAFEVEIDGLKCLALNAQGKGSKTFDSIEDNKYDAYIVFYYDGSKFNISIYRGRGDQKKNIKVDGIAKKFKGGGHEGAAGFQVEMPVEKILPFKRIENMIEKKACEKVKVAKILLKIAKDLVAWRSDNNFFNFAGSVTHLIERSHTDVLNFVKAHELAEKVIKEVKPLNEDLFKKVSSIREALEDLHSFLEMTYKYIGLPDEMEKDPENMKFNSRIKKKVINFSLNNDLVETVIAICENLISEYNMLKNIKVDERYNGIEDRIKNDIINLGIFGKNLAVLIKQIIAKGGYQNIARIEDDRKKRIKENMEERGLN